MKTNIYLVTIDDPDFAEASSFIRIIKLVLEVVNFRYVILYDIVGAGLVDGIIYQMQEYEDEDKVIEIDDFFNLLSKVKSFEWADFYFFEHFPELWEDKGNIKDFLLRNNQSETTVRAIDGQYIYIYTDNLSIVNIIKNNYEIESLTHDYIAKLPYPG